MASQIIFQDRKVVIGFKGNEHGKWNNKRRRPATYDIGDFHYFVTAQAKPVYPMPGKIWHPIMPDPEGTVTLVFNYGRKITSLNKTVLPRWFYCPNQWEMVMDSTHPVPAELWEEAIDIAFELLLGFLISLIAHQMYWREEQIKEPSTRRRLTVGEVLDQYGDTAKLELARDRKVGMPGWSEQDGCDDFFADCPEL